MAGISRYDIELDRWIADVDELAAALVNEGYEPWAAHVEARNLIRKRRADERRARLAGKAMGWPKKTSCSR